MQDGWETTNGKQLHALAFTHARAHTHTHASLRTRTSTGQVLEDKYGGVAGREFVADFAHYARVLFQRFGGKVKHWITINEPWVRLVPWLVVIYTSATNGGAVHQRGSELSTGAPHCCCLPFTRAAPSKAQHIAHTTAPIQTNQQPTNNNPPSTKVVAAMAYGSGEFAPGIPRGDAGQYAAGHHMILAHAAAAEIYDKEFRSAQGGRVGVALNTFWCAPPRRGGRRRRRRLLLLNVCCCWLHVCLRARVAAACALPPQPPACPVR